MKFGKEFASQMVPEWQEAYMDYDFLKRLLKEIHVFKSRHKPSPSSRPAGVNRSLTLYRAFSGLTRRVTSPGAYDVESQVIRTHNVRRDDDERAETTFLNAAEDGGEYELVYFKRLDDEFNKVVKFYKGKVAEVVKEADVLNKQMNALIAFRIKVENPNGLNDSFDRAADMLASDVAVSRAAFLKNAPSAVRASRRGGHHLDSINEEGSVRIDKSKDEIEMKDVNSEIQENSKAVVEMKGIRPVPLEILNNVKFNTVEETPRSTIKGFLKIPRQDELNFNKDSLKKAEEQLKRAFVEFYQKLRLLKNYSFLNIMGFSKIMKKYDKITSRHAARSYMKMVDHSYLGSSDEVSKMMERVEATFIKHFSNSNRNKGMNILRPKKKREKHRVTFSMGFAFGCSVALVVALVLLIRAHNIINKAGRQVYMDTLFPLYCLFGFIVLHLSMYAGNIFFWRKYRVNYVFIFGFKEGTELGYAEVLLCASCLSVLALASVLANLDMEMDKVTQDYKAITELLPLGLVVLLTVIMLCPFNIFYRSSRFFLLVSLFHCILSPLYKVTLPDFILADQLTSQVQALRSLEYYICYYGWGDYKRRETNCTTNGVFITFSFIVAAIPYMWRLLQCLRRLYDEKDAMQGYNGLKYFSTIIAVCARTAHTRSKSNSWQTIALIASIIATVISTYWDIVLDWGLLQRSSKNKWLRDKLLVPFKSVYYIAIVLNVFLRLAWMQTVLSVNLFALHKQTMITIVACLEIIRRGIWNFFRLENEHLNNVGKFRAFKSVPLPFNYEEDDEDKDD